MAMKRAAFYDALRPTLGALTQANVVGFERVLDEAIRRRTPLHDLAYLLSTTWWETGKTMQPVREAYWLSEAWRKKHLRYYPWYGRGLIQTTWEDNYRRLAIALGLPEDFFLKSPDKLLEWKYAIPALFVGMETGLYTGKALDDYIDDLDEGDDEDLREFINARRIVNGTDRAAEIGRLALMFEGALEEADYRPIVQPDDPGVPEPPTKKPALSRGAIITILIGAAALVAFFIFT